MVKQAEHDEPFDDRTCIEQLLADQCFCQLCQRTLMMLMLMLMLVLVLVFSGSLMLLLMLMYTMFCQQQHCFKFSLICYIFSKHAICPKLRRFTMFQDTWQPGGGLLEMKSLFCLFHGASVPLTCIVGDSIPTILQLLAKCEQKDFARKVD